MAYHWDDKQPINIPDELEIAEFDLLDNRTAETTMSFSTGWLSRGFNLKIRVRVLYRFVR